jgi:hypothetical protein
VLGQIGSVNKPTTPADQRPGAVAGPVQRTASTGVGTYPDDVQWPMWGRTARRDFRSNFGFSTDETIGQRWPDPDPEAPPPPSCGVIPFSPVIDNLGTIYFVNEEGTVYRTNPYSGNSYQWGPDPDPEDPRTLAAAPLLGKDLRLYVVTTSSGDARTPGNLRLSAYDLQRYNGGNVAWSIDLTGAYLVTAPYPLATGGEDPAYYFAYEDVSAGQQMIGRLYLGDATHTVTNIYDESVDATHTIINIAVNDTPGSDAETIDEHPGAIRELYRITLADSSRTYISGPPLREQGNDLPFALPEGTPPYFAPKNSLMINREGTVFEVGETWRIWDASLAAKTSTKNMPERVPDMRPAYYDGPDINWLNDRGTVDERHYSLIMPTRVAAWKFWKLWGIWGMELAPTTGGSSWAAAHFLEDWVDNPFGPAPAGGGPGSLYFVGAPDNWRTGMTSLDPGSAVATEPVIVAFGGLVSDDPTVAPYFKDTEYYSFDVSSQHLGYENEGTNHINPPVTTHYNAPPVVGQIGGETYVIVTGHDEGWLTQISNAESFPPQPDPHAALTAAPNPVFTGVTVTFDASSSYDDYSKIVGYTWHWGDGTPDEGPSSSPGRTHVYATPGTYTATVTIINGEGLTDTASVTMHVKAPPAPSKWYRAWGNNANTLYSSVFGPTSAPSQTRTVTTVNSGAYMLGAIVSSTPTPALAPEALPFMADGEALMYFGDSTGASTLVYGGSLDSSFPPDQTVWIGADALKDLSSSIAAIHAPAIGAGGYACYVGVPSGIYLYKPDGTLDWDNTTGTSSLPPLITVSGGSSLVTVVTATGGTLDCWRSDGTVGGAGSRHLWSTSLGTNISDICMDSAGNTYAAVLAGTSYKIMEVDISGSTVGAGSSTFASSAGVTLSFVQLPGVSNPSRVFAIKLVSGTASLVCWSDALGSPLGSLTLPAFGNRPAFRNYFSMMGHNMISIYATGTSGGTSTLTKYLYDTSGSFPSSATWTRSILSGTSTAGLPSVTDVTSSPLDATSHVYISGDTSVEAYTDNGTTSSPLWTSSLSGGTSMSRVLSIAPDGALWTPGLNGSYMPTVFRFGP